MTSSTINSVSLITGGAGFIASNLIGPLLESGVHVVVADDFSRGDRKNLARFEDDPRVQVVPADLADRGQCEKTFARASAVGRIDEVWHLAANSDIPAGVADPDIDLKDTFLTTFELLRAMKQFEVRNLMFASSSAIYGDLGDVALHEAIGPLHPISNYGSMKLASEAQISAAAESHLERALLYRFPNVVGVPATHGVILDFVNKLKADPAVLRVLGDGSQQKSYLHVSDLVDAMLLVRARASSGVEAINIGPVDDGVTVRWIAEQVVARVNPRATISFGTGGKGWVGDVPRFRYSTAKLQGFGWKPTMGSEIAVSKAIDEIARGEGF
jgi:UDP-glucose 4-epimerase